MITTNKKTRFDTGKAKLKQFVRAEVPGSAGLKQREKIRTIDSITIVNSCWVNYPYRNSGYSTRKGFAFLPLKRNLWLRCVLSSNSPFFFSRINSCRMFIASLFTSFLECERLITALCTLTNTGLLKLELRNLFKLDETIFNMSVIISRHAPLVLSSLHFLRIIVSSKPMTL